MTSLPSDATRLVGSLHDAHIPRPVATTTPIWGARQRNYSALTLSTHRENPICTALDDGAPVAPLHPGLATEMQPPNSSIIVVTSPPHSAAPGTPTAMLPPGQSKPPMLSTTSHRSVDCPRLLLLQLPLTY
jgi:hypothetical protein